jgi:hypothetical protein
MRARVSSFPLRIHPCSICLSSIIRLTSSRAPRPSDVRLLKVMSLDVLKVIGCRSAMRRGWGSRLLCAGHGSSRRVGRGGVWTAGCALGAVWAVVVSGRAIVGRWCLLTARRRGARHRSLLRCSRHGGCDVEMDSSSSFSVSTLFQGTAFGQPGRLCRRPSRRPIGGGALLGVLTGRRGCWSGQPWVQHGGGMLVNVAVDGRSRCSRARIAVGVMVAA